MEKKSKDIRDFFGQGGGDNEKRESENERLKLHMAKRKAQQTVKMHVYPVKDLI